MPELLIPYSTDASYTSSGSTGEAPCTESAGLAAAWTPCGRQHSPDQARGRLSIPG